MGALLVPVVIFVVLVVVVAVAVKRFGSRQIEHSDALQDPARETLRYEVPPGQDPAAVLIGLREAGYDASTDAEPGPSSPVVVIGATGGAPDREALRRTLADLEGTNVNPDESETVDRARVRFTDE